MANEAKVARETKVGEVRSECGDCKMVVGRMDKAMQCELCELWFHCKCESISEDSYKLMGQDKIHFYCGRCDKAAGKILKTILGIQARQTKMEGELNKVKGEVEEINKRPYVVQEQLKEVVQHFESEIEDVKKAVLKGSQDWKRITQRCRLCSQNGQS
jgi:chemotaxis regulatin CheY-phosphate phosphatase CheZ